MLERFTDRARKVMALANQEAQHLEHEYIGTEHILLGLLKEGSGVGASVLKNLDIDLGNARLEIEKLAKSGDQKHTVGKLPQTSQTKNVIRLAIEEARSLSHNYVGTEHLLLGLIRETEGLAAKILMELNLSFETVHDEILKLLGETAAESGPTAAGSGPTAEAKEGDASTGDAQHVCSAVAQHHVTGEVTGTCPHCGGTVHWDLRGAV